MRLPLDSLRVRIVLGAAVWIVSGLMIAGWIVAGLFSEHATEQFRRDLEVHITELSATVIVDANGAPSLLHPLSDPRFANPASGYYWQIDRPGHPPLRSTSLGDRSLPAVHANAPTIAWGEAVGPTGPMIEYGLSKPVPDGGPPLKLSLASDLAELTAITDSFRQVLLASLFTFGLVLSAGGGLYLAYNLRSLARLGRTISDLRSGRRPLRDQDFPSEIRPLVEDLGALLDANASIVQRARVQAGNLAHGLRTPLAVVMDEAERLERAGHVESAAALLEQSHKMQRQIDYHLARSRAAVAVPTPGLFTSVRETLPPILTAMGRLHLGRGVYFTSAPRPDALIACDPTDFGEIVSCLLDNAGKWATSSVQVDWSEQDGMVRLVIEDDGPGLDPEAREQVFAIGERLDDTLSGSGLGLAIARDLATLYGGRVWLDAREPAQGQALKGLRAMVELPQAAMARP
jgi:signal transduction histidine kinase